MTLRALVLGSGYAGQGHTQALRDAGVEVVGMASRTDSVVRHVAEALEIPRAGSDWRALLAELRPDLVAVGTPAGTHLEMISAALDARCHVLADKPLTTCAPHARRLYAHSIGMGVKTAYAASFRYQPQALLARQLVASGAVGRVLEVECASHYNWSRLLPFGWPHRLDQGGGRLNNNFTHKLAIVLHIVGGEILSATGEARNDLKRAPIGPHIHDFREFAHSPISPEVAARGEWGDVDSDWSYTALVRIGQRAQPDTSVSALFRHNCLTRSCIRDHICVYGSEGVLHIEGAYATGAVLLGRGARDWEEIPIPASITDALPALSDATQRNWNQLAREFAADIQGLGTPGYLTFRDGWIFQEVIDAIRAGRGWQVIPHQL